MRMTEYPAITEFTEDQILIVDGDNGTKKAAVVDAFLGMLHLISPENHRNVFRGKNLGTSLTTEQKAAIQSGTFKDLWLGDYWVINGVNWRIVDFDYWYNAGDTAFTNHHLVIMPDTALYGAQMNTTNVTTGGYINSAMYTTNLAEAKNLVTSAFGDAILIHREYLTNQIDANTGRPNGGDWYNSDIDLPNECMMYGHLHHSPNSDGATVPTTYTISINQLALFSTSPRFIVDRNEWGGFWLRDVVTSTEFARISNVGTAACNKASNSNGVRPVFAIG